MPLRRAYSTMATALRVEMWAMWQRAPGQLGQQQVASHHDVLGSRRNAAQAQPHGCHALVHVAARAEAKVLAVVDQRQVVGTRRTPWRGASRANLITGWPSSEMATAPAAFMAPMAASSSPALPLVMAPIGNTFTTA